MRSPWLHASDKSTLARALPQASAQDQLGDAHIPQAELTPRTCQERKEAAGNRGLPAAYDYILVEINSSLMRELIALRVLAFQLRKAQTGTAMPARAPVRRLACESFRLSTPNDRQTVRPARQRNRSGK
jgi:hypothetical protein